MIDCTTCILLKTDKPNTCHIIGKITEFRSQITCSDLRNFREKTLANLRAIDKR